MSPGPFGLKPQRVGFPRPFYFLTRFCSLFVLDELRGIIYDCTYCKLLNRYWYDQNSNTVNLNLPLGGGAF